MDFTLFKNKKNLVIIFLSFFLLVLLSFGGYFFYKDYFDKKFSELINSRLGDYSFENCKFVSDNFEKIEKTNQESKYLSNLSEISGYKEKCLNTYKISKIEKNFGNCKSINSNPKEFFYSSYLDISTYDDIKNKCLNTYNLDKKETNLELCKSILTSTKSDLEKEYLVFDSFDKKKNDCIKKYFSVKISTGTLFNPRNDFKSSIKLNFSIPFYKDIGKIDDEEFLENRIEAKKKLLSLIDIKPEMNLSIDNIFLYPKYASLDFDLSVNKDYEIKLNSFDTMEGLDTKETSFSFKTPDSEYLEIEAINPVSLYRDTNPPRFKLREFNTGKKDVGLKLCRIDNETYAKLEVFKKSGTKSKAEEDFLKNGLDNVKAFKCHSKKLIFNENEKNLYREIVFDFDDEIGTPSRSGLYFLAFDNYLDRERKDKVKNPIFFGIIDSHISMKVSRNGEGFFFVNDFDGKALENQTIIAYPNDFKEKERKWNRNDRKYDEKNFSALDTEVFSTGIVLGKTDKSGVLKVDFKGKIDDAFSRSFENILSFEDYGLYKSFFISSSSKTNLSFNSSTWNAGIAPNNFGYVIGNNWWYGDENSNDLKLNKWGATEPEFYSHVYTDRILYLPGEEINIKGIIRKSKDLSAPENKEFNLIVKDSNKKEIFNKKIKSNEFGSVFDKLSLKKDSPLGDYSIYLKNGEKQIGFTKVSVEIFKNPKFKIDIGLKAFGLEGGSVKIEEENKRSSRWTEYTGKFDIKANISGKYYNGTSLGEASFSYKVFKQPYRDNSWWDDCFYGCYREPRKEFYTSGQGSLKDGIGVLNIPIDFKSDYEDYKYILELTVKDNAGDTISSSNSVIAKLPLEYKRRNRNSSVYFDSENNFYKAGEKAKITGGLNSGKWSKYYDDNYIFVIKKKDYETKYVNDVRGVQRPITKQVENIEKVILVNSKNFKVSNDGKLNLEYKLKETGEYVFEYSKIDEQYLRNFDKNINDDNFNSYLKGYVDEFNKSKSGSIIVQIYKEYRLTDISLVNFDKCLADEKCYIDSKYGKGEGSCSFRDDAACKDIIKKVPKEKTLNLNSLLSSREKRYFSTLSYGETDAKNPIVDDNKIKILSEKVVYKLGEKARFLIRLPFSKGKILWTVERAGVLKSELIDVNSNMFFKEIEVDDSFVPNAYIGVIAIDTSGEKIPEYKVGYAEIVVDKSDKKLDIEIKSNKKTYKPREEVVLDIALNRPFSSELSVMVIDDSLISLMGNVDLNLIDKFFKKLDFQTQTSLTNLAMLKNYYFSRPGIVGGSGFGNFKGGDSAVSSRNIFKNTAYYNPSVITDKNGKASVKFNLPDNLTNFRVIVIANSKQNYFGAGESFIEVRKNVILEDKTPFILRDGDKLKMGANLFNTTDKEIGFKLSLDSDDLNIKEKEKNISIKANSSEFIYWELDFSDSKNKEKISYKITALGDSAENSDKIENTIDIKESPVLITNTIVSKSLEKKDKKVLEIEIGENIDIEKSKVELILSNNRLNGIEKIVSSLETYPHGCIEQTTSSTYPNAVLKKFSSIFYGILKDNSKIDDHLKAGIDRILGMQTNDGGFAYWPGGTSSNLRITPYVLRSLIDMKEVGAFVNDDSIKKIVSYMEKNYKKSSGNLEKAEILWALAKYGNIEESLKNIGLENLTDSFAWEKMDRHSLIAYTYAMILADKDKYKKDIEINIEKIKTLLSSEESSSRYRNKLSDKAIFASMLIDYDYDPSYTDKIIGELYNRDWSSYYYSTQAKNNAFMAFAKYIEKYGKNNLSTGDYSFVFAKTFSYSLGEENPNIFKKEFSLKDVINEGIIELSIENKSGNNIFADLILKEYPLDKTKISSYSNGVSIKRNIYKIEDEKKYDICNNNSFNYRKKYSDEVKNCDSIFKKVESNNFEKGKLYKVDLVLSLDSDRNRQNMSIEDYLPSSFRLINSKFKTESISQKQDTIKQSWYWDHIEFKSDMLFINASNFWGNSANFTYFFRPEFEGTFTYPPVTAYEMYNPEIRANSEYRIIEVK